MQDKWLKIYNHTKELARKRERQQQNTDNTDNSEKLGEIKQNKNVNDDDDKGETSSTDSEGSQSGGEEDDCANFIRETINSRPSTEAIKEENYIFSCKKDAKKKPQYRGNKRPILGTPKRWRRFLGLNDSKIIRHGKFVTIDELAKQFSGGRVITRGAAKKRKNEEEKEEGDETLTERKQRKKRRKKGEKSDGEEEGEDRESKEEEGGNQKESSTKTEERNGEKRNREEETEEGKITEEGGIAKEEGGIAKQEGGYKNREQQPIPPEEETQTLAAEEARKKISQAQEVHESNKTTSLPIGSLIILDDVMIPSEKTSNLREQKQEMLGILKHIAEIFSASSNHLSLHG